MSEYVVETLLAPIFDSCSSITKIRDKIWNGEDMLMIDKDEIQDRRDEHQYEKDDHIEQSSKQEYTQPTYTKNIETLYYLTVKIQDNIDEVLNPHFTGKIRHDQQIRSSITRFFDESIELYSNQLVTYIEGLIIYERFDPRKFQGYTNIAKMITESTGHKKMNYLLALTNIARLVIPPDITTKPVHVIEPSISKSSNPKDA